MSEPDVMKGANIIIHTCGAVKRNDSVVIATDHDKTEIADILLQACKENSIDAVVINMKPRKNHGEDPPVAYAAALKEADVVFAATTYSLFHSSARVAACNGGTRWVNIPGFSKKMLTQGGLFVDFHKQRKNAETLGAFITEGSTVRVVTEKGTDITFSIEGRSAIVESGISDEPGMVNSPPDIEVCIAPIEGTSNGTVVVDGSIVVDELGPLENDVKLEVVDGMVVNVTGSKEAMVFKRILEEAEDKEVRNVGEFGVGLNPKCTISESMLEAEGVLGTIHFGIGDNHTMGGIVEASMHTDIVVMNPTVFIDDIKIMEKGTHLKI